MLHQDNTTKSVIDTPPSETWQIAFNPTADRLTVAAAGGSSNRVVIWSCDDASSKEQLGLPAVSPCYSSCVLLRGI